MVAPICPGTTSPPVQTFGVNRALRFPSIPHARDLQSALAAINAMREAIMLLSQQIQQQPEPPARPQTSAGAGGSGAKTQPKKKKPSWKETQRVVKKERIENPDDSSQYVEVEIIQALTLTNSATGEQWVWKRQR